MWSMDMAKSVLEEAEKALEEREKQGFKDTVLQETANYLDFALATVEWHNKAAEERAAKKEAAEKEAAEKTEE